ncbi:GRIP domain-containing protein [Trametes pubescens]|uniref:GRIP domain-containing protein n=1 Tax=Trametes pubescens TaxID=154538 RepID=A0A1M2VWX9_TRAPU|nr:GRIP domain-containing protein [Trametes pubescens]
MSSSPSLSDVASNDDPTSRRSLDGERILGSPPPLNGLSGKPSPNGDAHQDSDNLDPMQRLERELQRTREEKDTLATQYRNLLAKLTTMRTTLGNKLKQDAEELDRQEQLVQQLTVQNEDFAVTVETLKAELIASNEEAERASKELEVMRSRALQDSAQESYLRERELRELQAELEQCRIERDEWEQKALQEHISADEARTTADVLLRDLEAEREARQRAEGGFEMEREKSNNLQSVLEDFQAAKDHDLKQAVRDYESQLLQVTQSLAEYKSRALNAELQLEESSTNNTRVQELEKEVKDKGFLIGKLRHEAVIMNEHLMEALRRLRRSSTDTNVDRRLVTNILLSFLTTPRADSKRFEMLSLLATILSWNDDEREKAGLQRNNTASHASSLPSLFGRSSASSPSLRPAELDKTDETESFSRLWVEFLLTQAAAGEGSPPPPKSPRTSSARPNGSLPSTPTQASTRLSPIGLGGPKHLPSFTTAAMASSPDLQLASPPRGKGKERAVS